MSSLAFDKIVPFGQNLVLDDMPVTLTFKERVAFFLCLIYVSVDSRKYNESRLGSCLGSHIAGLLDGVEDDSAPYSGNLREEHVLYGITLGAVRRIVCNPDVDAQSPTTHDNGRSRKRIIRYYMIMLFFEQNVASAEPHYA